jgi:hypothetical protein
MVELPKAPVAYPMHQENLDVARFRNEETKERQSDLDALRTTADGNEESAWASQEPGLHHADREDPTPAYTE